MTTYIYTYRGDITDPVLTDVRVKLGAGQTRLRWKLWWIRFCGGYVVRWKLSSVRLRYTSKNCLPYRNWPSATTYPRYHTTYPIQLLSSY